MCGLSLRFAGQQNAGAVRKQESGKNTELQDHSSPKNLLLKECCNDSPKGFVPTAGSIRLCHPEPAYKYTDAKRVICQEESTCGKIGAEVVVAARSLPDIFGIIDSGTALEIVCLGIEKELVFQQFFKAFET